MVHFERGASALYFLDGGGNVVELIDNNHLTNDSDAPFGRESLLEVAEIGLATADINATRAVIQEVLSAGVLWGGEDGSLLTAIGDDYGVVIVAPTGRSWIPVGLPAQPLPTTIVAVGPQSRVVKLAEGPYTIRADAGNYVRCQGVNSFQCPSETTSTAPSTTLMAVWSSIAYAGTGMLGGPSFRVGHGVVRAVLGDPGAETSRNQPVPALCRCRWAASSSTKSSPKFGAITMLPALSPT